MQPKNIKPQTRATAPVPRALRCMKCGMRATVVHTDEREGDVPLRTTWCDWCAPDVWSIVARARRIATQRWGSKPDADPYVN